MSKTSEKKLIKKFLIILLHIVIITILFVEFYKVFKEKNSIKNWDEVENTNEYAYIEISKMSEAFATYKEQNITFHFVIEQASTGIWHTYVVAIKKEDYNKYKNIIDYTYERLNEKPNSVKIYGYPVIIDNNLKELIIKNVNNFLPKENTIEITKDNYEIYLTNSYLDSTKPRKKEFPLKIAFYSFLLFTSIISLFLTTLCNNSFSKRKKIAKKKKNTYNK